MRLLRRAGALLLFVSATLCAARGEPRVKATHFDNTPTDIHYFDDSDVVLVTLRKPGIVHRSTDGGVSWKEVGDIGEGKISAVFTHPNDNKVAVALGRGREHWITRDQGESWDSFKTELDPVDSQPLKFHATDSAKFILNTYDGQSQSGNPPTEALYTTDSFKHRKPLREQSVMCAWAKQMAVFTSGSEDDDENRILCVVQGRMSTRPESRRLVASNNYFKSEDAVDDETGRPLTGITSMAAVTRYVLVGREAEGSNEMVMYVSTDSKEWHRAEFIGQKLLTQSFTIMESSNYSIQVDVTPEGRGPMGRNLGMLFSSNSNGTYFTRNDVYTNQDEWGYADYERIANTQGVALANTVENARDVLDGRSKKKTIKSKITFDDGRTFEDLRAGDEDLNLHSVTDFSNSGRVFSSPAPGLAMGVGNTGKKLEGYGDGHLYVSDTGGVSWYMALKGPHKYEFGDQGSILLAVFDGDAGTDRAMYSLEHGREGSWKKLPLDEDEKFKPIKLTTVPDSTSKKFLLQGDKGHGAKKRHVLYSIDFEPIDLPKCKRDDFERWYARADGDKPGCVMGHTQSFMRRKAKAACFVDRDFEEELPENDKLCTCTAADYECDTDFTRSEDRKECIPAGKLQPPEGACKDDDDTFEGPSGWRLIPGNTCKQEDGEKKDGTAKYKCKDKAGSKPPPKDGKLEITATQFGKAHKAESFRQYLYLERGDESPETVLVVTDPDRSLFVSQDQGRDWQTPKDHHLKEQVLVIYPNRYEHDDVYFITNSEEIYYSRDRAAKIHHFKAPAMPTRKPGVHILHFHAKHPNWLIFIGCTESSSRSNPCSEQDAYYSTNGGEEWHTLHKAVESCDFVYTEGRPDSEKLVYCIIHPKENSGSEKALVSSSDWFETKDTLFKDIANFATMADFIVVAKKDDKEAKYLNLMTSLDGVTFAEAKFPHDFEVAHETAYSVLDSSTGSIFVHITINGNPEQEYGTILKSNSNGTYFVKSLDNVSRDLIGYADFEKMLGLEGASLANVVANVDEVNKGSKKQLRTLMSHNDGADWSLIKPPTKDSEDKPYECTGESLEKCSLHLHGYTERDDYRDTLSSPSATGIIMGVGNVGPALAQKKDGNTFISSDGGVNWREVIKGQYQWEFGDQGSIIVIVSQTERTNTIHWSRTRGEKWDEYKFWDEKVRVTDITTTPTDGSLKFLLWAHVDGDPVSFRIDFSNLVGEQCRFSEKEGGDTDYEVWTPRHPNQDNDCLFGHVAGYYRKKIDSDCFNGPPLPERGFAGIRQNCTCSARDFECAFNYERASDQSCKLIAGLEPEDPMAVCEQKGVNEYFSGVAYRKIPLDTCAGGMKLDGELEPCPGKEEEFKKKHPGISSVGLFFAITIPLLAAGGIGYFAWKQYESKYGRIRLGDAGGPSFDTNSKWVAWPIAALSAVAAAVLAIPAIAGTLWRTVNERFGRTGGGSSSRGGYRSARPYTSRRSFARSGGNYSIVGNDESDLLGEDDSEDDI